MVLKSIRLQTEPGRSFFGNTGIHLTSVEQVKEQAILFKLNWVLTNTTCFFLNGSVIEHSLQDCRSAGHDPVFSQVEPNIPQPDVACEIQFVKDTL
ncbi:hypothetical protein [Ruegeria arenilitoris]|uniref:hypothetical protein n=1 Tax=Ruegeria arenilitoris TaxID=1173585 RepID=UPI00147FEBF9|nr:hypothetical protein [Ruegeria arenilitoris]